jgi:hypothetical protein
MIRSTPRSFYLLGKELPVLIGEEAGWAFAWMEVRKAPKSFSRGQSFESDTRQLQRKMPAI